MKNLFEISVLREREKKRTFSFSESKTDLKTKKKDVNKDRQQYIEVVVKVCIGYNLQIKMRDKHVLQ